MHIDSATGLLSTARYLASPNCDERPPGTLIDLLVVHNISLPPKCFGTSYIIDFFTNSLQTQDHPYFREIASLRVSAHCLVRRTGEVIQFVPFHKRAWHAGCSCFAGRTACNNFSIGIELEGADDIPYTRQQYVKLAQISALLQPIYPQITSDRIVGHSDIAPGRKTDPGPAFDWQQFFRLLQHGIGFAHL